MASKAPAKKPAALPGTGNPAPVATSTQPSDIFGSLASPGAASTPFVAPPGMDPRLAAQLQQAQSAANNANNQRYGQGLAALTGGYNASQGSISQALNASSAIGGAEKETIARNLQNAQGSTAQSAVNRGIGNTTVVDALQQGNQRTANSANNAVDESIANRSIGLYQNQAQNAANMGGQISNFIAQRNDTAPNVAQYADLQRQAQQSSAPISTGVNQFSGQKIGTYINGRLIGGGGWNGQSVGSI